MQYVTLATLHINVDPVLESDMWPSKNRSKYVGSDRLFGKSQ